MINLIENHTNDSIICMELNSIKICNTVYAKVFYLLKFGYVTTACCARMFVSLGGAGSNSELKFGDLLRPDARRRIIINIPM